MNGTDIGPDSIVKVGGFIGEALSINSTHTVFSIPPLVTPSTLSQYPSLSK